jgi:divalent metal cation (Fe/Co/Zn/Cd) transporter
LMELALLWSAVPAVFLGRAKLPLARDLHDKVLFADAKINKADWLTAVAGMAGVLGIGLGLWWADSVAAAIISVDILYDGVENLRAVVTDLMDSRPTTVDDKVDPLPARVENELRKRTWVKDVRARLREEGHVYFGEIFVVPSTEQNLLGNVERAHRELHDMDWRLHDVVVTPTKSLEDQDEPNDEG